MPTTRIELAMPVRERRQTYDLNRVAFGIDLKVMQRLTTKQTLHYIIRHRLCQS